MNFKVGLMHLTRVRMGNVKRFLQFVQEAIPIQLKEIHVLNVVYFIDKILGLIKPFMKTELFKLVVLKWKLGNLVILLHFRFISIRRR